MSIVQRSRAAIKRIVFGDSLLPQEFTVGLVEPQTEISVGLHGMGVPLDVTRRFTTACCAPLMLCVGFDEGEIAREKNDEGISLKFCEREGRKRLLGEIHLTPATTIAVGGSKLVLFSVRGSINYCLPRLRLWAHYLLQAYKQWRWLKNPDVKMSLFEQRAAMVTFIRPHPVVLASINGESGGNIFPMNLMGELGNGYFGFALKDSRMAAHLVERAGRVALSSVPLAQSSLAYQYAIHHTKPSIDWDQLPFEVKMSEVFKIPFPDFALRVREMEVEKVMKIGSHTFFIARTVSDKRLSEGLQVNVIHGFYQAARFKDKNAQLKASISEDSINKRGPELIQEKPITRT